jgi:hypothetical protein
VGIASRWNSENKGMNSILLFDKREEVCDEFTMTLIGHPPAKQN